MSDACAADAKPAKIAATAAEMAKKETTRWANSREMDISVSPDVHRAAARKGTAAESKLQAHRSATSGRQSAKKTDVAERPWASHHVGLLVNQPPGLPGCFLFSRPTTLNDCFSSS